MRLVSIAALLRRYSPRLTFYSKFSVTFLLSFLVANYNLLSIRFCHTKVVNFTRLYPRGLSQLLGSPNRTPLKIHLKSLKADTSTHQAQNSHTQTQTQLPLASPPHPPRQKISTRSTVHTTPSPSPHPQYSPPPPLRLPGINRMPIRAWFDSDTRPIPPFITIGQFPKLLISSTVTALLSSPFVAMLSQFASAQGEQYEMELSSGRCLATSVIFDVG